MGRMKKLHGLMDALYFRTARASEKSALPGDDVLSISHALATELDGSAVGACSDCGSVSSPGGSQSEMDIPNFPPFSVALLQDEWIGSEEHDIPRTSGEFLAM